MIKRQKSLFIIFWITLMWIVCASAGAETIRLMNGRIFDGEIAEESGDEVKILMKSGIVTFSRDEIASIGDRKISEKDTKKAVKSLSAPVALKKPVVKKTIKTVTLASKPAQKKKQKAQVKVSKQVPRSKAAQPAVLPAVAVDTATVNSLSASTDTAPLVSTAPIASPASLPTKPRKGLSPTAKAAVVTAAIAIIALIVRLIKRMRRQPKDI